MSQIFEALRKAERVENKPRWKYDLASEPPDRRTGDRHELAANIRVYGHEQGMAPFFEEHSILNASETGALLLMRTAVVAGQKLLLINEAAEQVQECRVIRTSVRDSKELEVAVEFPNPHPDFWRSVDKPGTTGVEKRKHPRVTLPRGMDVVWRARGESVRSKIQTISAGGVSIAAPAPALQKELLHLSFEVPAGEVIARAVVRHSCPEMGMGVEFLAMSDEARKRLDHLLRKLLR